MWRLVLILVVVGLVSMPSAEGVADAEEHDSAWRSVQLNLRPEAVITAGGTKAVIVGSPRLGDTSRGLGTVVDVYDTATGQWSSLTLSETRRSAVAVAVGEQVLFAGGLGAEGASTVVDIYDVPGERWTTASLTRPIWGTAYTPSRQLVDGAVAVVGTRALFLGAHSDSLGPPPDVLDVYDSTTGQWSNARLPQPRTTPKTAVVGSKVLFFGGATVRARATEVDVLDIHTGRWSTGALSQLCRPEVTVAGTRALFACIEDPARATNLVDVYDAATDHWAVAKLSQSRARPAIAAVGSRVLFAGGQVTGPPLTLEVSFSDVVDVYDGTTDSWSTARLARPRLVSGAASVGTRALFAGGAVGTAPAMPPLMPGQSENSPGSGRSYLLELTDLVDVYDDATGQWSTAALSQARSGFAIATVGTRILFAGGLAPRDRYRNEHFATVDAYDASTDRWHTGTLAQARVPGMVTTVGGQVLIIGGALIAVGSPAPMLDPVVDIYDSNADP